MRTHFIAFIACGDVQRILVFVCGLFFAHSDIASATEPNGRSRIWFTIEDSEYEIRWQEGVGAHQSPNRAQNLRLTYLNNGFVAERRTPQTVLDEWRIALELEMLGEANAGNGLGRAELAVAGKSAKVEASGVTIEYFNSREGLRQRFILHESSANGEFRLNLRAHLEDVQMYHVENEAGGETSRSGTTSKRSCGIPCLKLATPTTGFFRPNWRFYLAIGSQS